MRGTRVSALAPPRAAREGILKRVVDKSFVARAPLEVAWNHLAQIEAWPSWAKHIRFRMIDFEPLRHWKWAGSFLGSQILYDHIFSEDTPNQTTIRFTVDTGGGPAVLIRGIFGWIYRRNLERAVPLLVQEIEGTAASKP